jgi:hypothetical protein
MHLTKYRLELFIILLKMTTAKTNMTTGNDNFDEGKEANIAVSVISNSTACVTLGKRDLATHTFYPPEASKRQKNFDSAS